jgi:hypothetical protein
MSWQPPSGDAQAIPEGWESTAPVPWYQQKAIVYFAGGVLAVGAVVAVSISREPADPPPDVARLIAVFCPSQAECGIVSDTSGDVYGFTLLPTATGFAGDALRTWGDETGCLEAVDYERIMQTRALDGMVESSAGRSTWTYHPDDGLNIVCEP